MGFLFEYLTSLSSVGYLSSTPHAHEELCCSRISEMEPFLLVFEGEFPQRYMYSMLEYWTIMM